jgi:hypothetical protein
MLKTILKSLLILTTISSSIALLIFDNTLFSFFKIFIFSTICQIIIYNLYKIVVLILFKKLENEKIKEYLKQGVETKCPCEKGVSMFLPIRLDSVNTFKCMECQKNFSVKIDVKTFQNTEIIDLEKSERELSLIFDEISKKEK